MKKAKIYIPTDTAMQSARGKIKKWVLEFITKDKGTNHLMGWETSTDTMSEVRLEFDSKELAIEYAKNNKINFYVIEPNKRSFIIKSYTDNFTK